MLSVTGKTVGAGRWAAVAAAATAAFCVDSEERAPMAMWEAPARAKDFAIARPRPREAPTMNTALLWAGAGVERGEMAG